MPLARTLVPLAVTAALLGGCGGGSAKPKGPDVAGAAVTTAGKRTAKVTVTAAVSGLGLPAGLKLPGTGVMALDRPEGDLTFDLSDLLGVAGILTGTDLRVHYDGATVYADPPDVPTLGIPEGWLSVDLRKVATALGIDPVQAAARFTVDAASQLAALRDAGDLTKVGPEKIDGVATTHYRSAKTRAEVWIDAHALVHRLRKVGAIPAQKGLSSAGSYDVTIDLSDFGTALDASPTEDATDMTGTIVSLLDRRD